MDLKRAMVWSEIGHDPEDWRGKDFPQLVEDLMTGGAVVPPPPGPPAYAEIQQYAWDTPEALAAGINTIADHPCTMINPLSGILFRIVMYTTTKYIHHTGPSVKPHIDSYAHIIAGIGKRAVNSLAVTYRHISRRTNNRHGIRQPVGSYLVDHGLYVYFP